MNCDESRQRLEIDVDGELDLVRHLELSAHLEICPACAERAQAARARQSALRAEIPRFTASPEFLAKIRASLSEGRTEKLSLASPDRNAARVRQAFWQYGGMAAMLMLSLLLGYRIGHRQIAERHLIDEAIDDHVRSLQANHLTDVASTDQHTVKPWFAGKLDFSPPVIDLAASGFPLFGGRMERLDDQPVAALIFHRHQHILNLFIWPGSGTSIPPNQTEHSGYRTESWSQNGFNFLAVSDLSSADLALFAQMYRELR